MWCLLENEDGEGTDGELEGWRGFPIPLLPTSTHPSHAPCQVRCEPARVCVSAYVWMSSCVRVCLRESMSIANCCRLLGLL